MMETLMLQYLQDLTIKKTIIRVVGYMGVWPTCVHVLYGLGKGTSLRGCSVGGVLWEYGGDWPTTLGHTFSMTGVAGWFALSAVGQTRCCTLPWLCFVIDSVHN